MIRDWSAVRGWGRHLLFGTIALAACDPTDAPLSPHAGPRFNASGYTSSASATLISITDDDGHTFSADAASHVLYIDGLPSVPLTSAQEAVLLPLLAGIVDADRLTEAACQAGPGGGGINEQLVISDPTDRELRQPRIIKLRRGGGTRRPAKSLAVRTTTGAAAPSLYAEELPCVDLAGAIYTATVKFRQSRAIVLNLMKLWASDLYELDPMTGLPRLRAPNPVQMGADIEVAIAGLAMDRTTLNILASIYRASGCWTGAWPGLEGGGFGSSGYWVKVCHSEGGWEISLDGGVTWAPLEAPVTVCEYVQSWQVPDSHIIRANASRLTLEFLVYDGGPVELVDGLPGHSPCTPSLTSDPKPCTLI